jgi:hypothetical protein
MSPVLIILDIQQSQRHSILVQYSRNSLLLAHRCKYLPLLLGLRASSQVTRTLFITNITALFALTIVVYAAQLSYRRRGAAIT